MSLEASEDVPRPPFVAGSALMRSAFALASRAHDGQEGRRDGFAYIRHPLAVARLLHGSGADERMLAAALLHDVVEDSDLSIGDVVERFGTDIGELVAALTEDDSLDDYEQRKAHQRQQVEEAGQRAAAIYVADKLANLRDIRDLYGDIGERVKERDRAPSLDTRIRLWREDAEMAARAVPDLTLTSELSGELRSFEAERARGRSTVSAR